MNLTHWGQTLPWRAGGHGKKSYNIYLGHMTKEQKPTKGDTVTVTEHFEKSRRVSVLKIVSVNKSSFHTKTIWQGTISNGPETP